MYEFIVHCKRFFRTGLTAPVACQDTGARSYKRIVAVCYRDGEDLGLTMVRMGWAFDAPKYSHGRCAAAESQAREAGLTMVRMGWAFDAPKYSHGRYAAAEAEAREAGRGIWQGECALPWVWRKANR